MAPAMEEEDNIPVRGDARRMLSEESSRTRGGFQPVNSGGESNQPTGPRLGADPGVNRQQAQGNMSSREDADMIRRIIPELAHMSDNYLTMHPLDRLMKYVDRMKHAEVEKREKDIEARLHQNMERALRSPIVVNHADNRLTVLHPARFLPGAAVPLADLWLEARKYWGRNPADALGDFDMMALGLPGVIPSLSWEILHNPGSREISIKRFTVANVARASDGTRTVTSETEDGFLIKESLKELSDMSELKTAIQNLKLAVQMVRPWDFSVTVLERFLVANDYLDSQLSNVKKAPAVAAFVDHVLQANAKNWTQSKPFLEIPALKALWDPWWAGHKNELKKEDTQKQGKNQDKWQKSGDNQQKGQGSGKGGYTPAGNWVAGSVRIPPPHFSGPPGENNICRMYNEKTCRNQYNTCVINGKFGPFRLYHLCNHTEVKNGKSEICRGKHPKPDHK